MDITVTDLCKSYDGRPVLQNFSAVFPTGSVSAILAPSGQGKTTLFRILAGLEEPDSGMISNLPGLRSCLFQEDRLFPQLSTGQNILSLSPDLQDKSRAAELLVRVGLPGIQDHPVSCLSGGMARRVALCRALLCPGELYLLDEPFRGLDDDSRALAARTILECTAGRTVILFAHEPAESRLLCAGSIMNLRS